MDAGEDRTVGAGINSLYSAEPVNAAVAYVALAASTAAVSVS